jgi:hypothetical protein
MAFSVNIAGVCEPKYQENLFFCCLLLGDLRIENRALRKMESFGFHFISLTFQSVLFQTHETQFCDP